jgi:alanyl-tRNA synthetase
MSDIKDLENTIKSFKSDEITGALDDIIASAKKVGEVDLITREFKNTDTDQLRSICDAVKEKKDNAVMVFAAVNDGKVTFITAVTEDLVCKGYNAGKIIKEAARAAGGGGGGKANMAQAGAKDPSKIGEAFAAAEQFIANQM